MMLAFAALGTPQGMATVSGPGYPARLHSMPAAGLMPVVPSDIKGMEGDEATRGGRGRFNGYSDAFDLTVYVHKNARPVAGALRSVPSRSGRRGGGGGTGERLCRMAADRAASAVQGKPWQAPYPQSAFRFG